MDKEEEQMINECLEEIDVETIEARRAMEEHLRSWEHEIYYE